MQRAAHKIICGGFFLLLFLCSLFCKGQNSITDSIKKILPALSNDTTKINALNYLSRLLINQGNPNEAMKFAKEALHLSTIIPFLNSKGWPKGKANALNNIGVIYYSF